MLENFNEDKRKNSMSQFSDFHTGWSINSPRAIAVNIRIIRVFSKIREMLTDNLSLKLEIEQIKKKLSNHGKNIELVFNYLDELIEKKSSPRKPIGYKTKHNDKE